MRWLRSIGSFVVLVVSVVAGNTPHAHADGREATDPVQDLPLFMQVREFRKDGRYDLALDAARRLLDEMEADPGAREYELRNRAEQVAILEFIGALPPDDQKALAAADRSIDDYRRAMGEARFADAARIAETQCAVRERLLGPRHHDLATSLHVLGLARHALGQYAIAESLFARSLSIYEERLGPRAASVAMSHDALGGLFQTMGDYERSVMHYREAVGLYRTYHYENEGPIAESMAGLARSLRGQGRYREAELVFTEAIRIARHAAAGNSLQRILADLARLLAGQSEWRRAEPLFREAIRLREEKLGPGHPRVAELKGELADLLERTNRPVEALELRVGVANTLEEALEDAHSGVAHSLVRLAESHLQLGHGPIADSLYERARDMIERSGATTHPDAAIALRGRGDVARAAGQLDRAAVHYEDALEELQGSLGTAHVAVMATHVRIATLAWMRNAPSEAVAPLERACAAFEGVRAQLGPPEQRATFRESPEPQLAAALLECGRPNEAWRVFERSRGRLLEDVLRLSGSDAAVPEAAAIERVQASLAPDAALLGWLDVEVAPSREVSRGWVLRRDGPVRWVETQSTAEADLRAMLTLAGSWPLRLDPDDHLTALAADVSRGRIAPLLSLLEGTTSWVIVPSGGMVGLPVEMLPDPTGRPYGDRLAISYAPSATFAAWSSERPKSNAERGVALVVGSPVLGPDESLPTSEAEIARVAATFTDARVLTGPRATEAELVRLAENGEMAQFETLHFATHAVVDATRPDLSALILSRDERGGLDEALGGERLTDGRLSAWEIAREWHIDADLVTLSGCGTALGREVEGEGYLGFADVLLRAGAHNLVVSLWNVDDEATARFMGRFYGNLQGGARSKAACLQEARVWLRDFRRADGSSPYGHPAYWAAFVLIGGATE